MTDLGRPADQPWRVLDAEAAYAADGGRPRPVLPTVYHPRRLVTARLATVPVQTLLSDAGYEVTILDHPDAATPPPFLGVEVTDPSSGSDLLPPVDAWRLRGWLVRQGVSPQAVALDHLFGIVARPYWGIHPYWGVHPYWGIHPHGGGDPAGEYGAPGTGGRTPVAAPPWAHRIGESTGEGPRVAVLDTGLGPHPWFPPTATTGVDAEDGVENPRLGTLSPAVGHGTFIAGLVRQVCPEAVVEPVAVADGQGRAEELGVLWALHDLATSATPPDVCNLSIGYYPEDPTAEHPVVEALQRCLDVGITLVAAAGNDATDRPMLPAAATAFVDDDTREPLPIAAVGALNPARDTETLFSNEGSWITHHRDGANLVSSMPTQLAGSMQSRARTRGRGDRATLDLDDFRSGYALWSGTSFAAPIVAGELACVLGRAAGPKVALDVAVEAGLGTVLDLSSTLEQRLGLLAADRSDSEIADLRRTLHVSREAVRSAHWAAVDDVANDPLPAPGDTP